MIAKTFLGTLNVRIGDYENRVRYLIVANSATSAYDVLTQAAASYLGDGNEPEEDGGFYANGGEVHTSATSLQPIGASTFLDLQQHLPVRCASNATAPTAETLSGSIQDAATALGSSLEAVGAKVGHSAVLNALAASWGEKNWQVLKAKFSAGRQPLHSAILAAAQAVVDNADSSGCSDDMTVTSLAAIESLEALLSAQRT